jgi:uncharacterized membrane protein YcaP (DUF421 family)
MGVQGSSIAEKVMSMFFDGWHDIFRVVVLGVLSYGGLVAFLRISGARTLSKLNAFDLAVTVALGSTLATALLSSDVSLVEGLTALALLILLQFLVAWGLVRSRLVGRLVKAEPVLLVSNGHLLPERLRQGRVAPEEVYQAVRARGRGDLHDVAAVVMETDGSFSVITQDSLGTGLTLDSVPAWRD